MPRNDDPYPAPETGWSDGPFSSPQERDVFRPIVLTPEERARMKRMDEQLASIPKLKDRPGFVDRAKDVAGKVWAAPNTAVGLAYGGAGHLAGVALHAVGIQRDKPIIRRGENAIDFLNNPLGGVGAVTLGNTTTWMGDPKNPTSKWYHPKDYPWTPETQERDIRHETAHTRQSEQLGPFYLLSNALGGLNAVARDRDKDGDPDWHGPHNWNERGPLANPPRPWPGPRK